MLGLLTATYRADYVFVESFEAGVHYDLAVGAIAFLDSLEANVFVESHIALTVTAALQMGWDVYYVHEGKAERI